ncbi:MAG: hypothetical protein P8L66_12665 [Rhodospirillaceae bacterium]|nr:hypothetical protein [Rhodospirillaceae bacterium]
MRVYTTSIAVLYTALFTTPAVGQDTACPNVDGNDVIHGRRSGFTLS